MNHQQPQYGQAAIIAFKKRETAYDHLLYTREALENHRSTYAEQLLAYMARKGLNEDNIDDFKNAETRFGPVYFERTKMCTRNIIAAEAAFTAAKKEARDLKLPNMEAVGRAQESLFGSVDDEPLVWAYNDGLAMGTDFDIVENWVAGLPQDPIQFLDPSTALPEFLRVLDDEEHAYQVTPLQEGPYPVWDILDKAPEGSSRGRKIREWAVFCEKTYRGAQIGVQKLRGTAAPAGEKKPASKTRQRVESKVHETEKFSRSLRRCRSADFHAPKPRCNKKRAFDNFNEDSYSNTFVVNSLNPTCIVWTQRGSSKPSESHEQAKKRRKVVDEEKRVGSDASLLIAENGVWEPV